MLTISCRCFWNHSHYWHHCQDSCWTWTSCWTMAAVAELVLRPASSCFISTTIPSPTMFPRNRSSAPPKDASCLQDKVQASYQIFLNLASVSLPNQHQQNPCLVAVFQEELPGFSGNHWLATLQPFPQAVPSCWNGLSHSLLCWGDGCSVPGPAQMPSILQNLSWASTPKAQVFLQHFV